ncbi:MAG: methylamine utilization protein MauG [Saccharospirillaceae bacterium]|nr:methylamine utilization protein MauG [Saccharospirillaceae bacterium]MCD8530596.1 methylamine utilization protein MauG [Saccharospirillaceae bacterium]
MKNCPPLLLVALLLSPVFMLSGCGGSDSNSPSSPPFASKEALGESLFHDTRLSANRTQSCATCHNPGHGFVDNRTGADGKVSPVSRGDNGTSFGDRNAPTAAYARFSPAFGQGSHTRAAETVPGNLKEYSGYIGGQFHDGRANGLAQQAAGPPLNPIEMGMESKAAVVERLLENPEYVEAFSQLYGLDLAANADAAYAAMTDAIAAFERSDTFAPFDSKYDRSLLPLGDANRYVYDALDKATQGKSLFFSQFTNCGACHQLKAKGQRGETFSNYEYHNIGVPVNAAARALSGVTGSDDGLLANPDISDDTQRGKFKVPTLRNVAVTGPYMHNGVFADLTTVVMFYDHLKPESDFLENPETGLPWAEPEVSANMSNDDLQQARTLTETEVTALVCFMRTLTDARYEHLLPDDGLCD